LQGVRQQPGMQHHLVLAAPPVVPRGLSPAEISALPCFEFAARHMSKSPDGDKAACMICLAEFAPGDTVRLLPCLHRYHRDCVDAWLAKCDECCLCKTPTRSA